MNIMSDIITWKIGGEAGFGIMSTGLMFSRLATRHGYEIFDYPEYPSLIRGGHNVYQVCVGKEVFSQEYTSDILIALNSETITLHGQTIKDGGVLVYDPAISSNELVSTLSKQTELYAMPFTKITSDAGVSNLMVNNVVLGASTAILGMELSILIDVIRDNFGKKGGEIVEENIKAATIGYEYVKNNPLQRYNKKLSKIDDHTRMVITGNEAVVLGAVSAGCQLYAAYPMTPTSAALHYFASLGEQYGIVVKHVEDEIAAINVAIGAGYAGVRAMTGTSGGGFSLMVEGLGLAGITETPVVILMGQRPGPATGMPTWTGQADLKFLIHASQDEFPRIVLAPGDMEEAFYLSAEAFNLSEKYQTPVFILIDKYIAEGHQSISLFDAQRILIDRGNLMKWDENIDNYVRYQNSDDGISKRALPGMKNIFTANSYEHNEYGLSTEDAKDRLVQIEKRKRKMNSYQSSLPNQIIYGPEIADITLVGWGSTKNPAKEALRRLSLEKYNKTVNYLHFTHVWPFPEDFAKKILSGSAKIMLLEGNSTAQLGSLIREYTGIDIQNKYLRYDGRPFYPEDIINKIKHI
jgi:2-oxoglutarate/2-oxoacid ferredoxin oxidoreductase subunit alpha